MGASGVDRLTVLGGARRIVVKVGSNVLTSKTGALDRRRVRHLAEQVSTLCDGGKEVIVVSSGAIAAGVGELGLPGRPKTMPELQAAAAVGQGRLIRAYNESFRRHGRCVGQVLLTREDMEDRARFLNTRNTLRALLDLGCVPIINENDSVSVEEIRYGDNDFLAAHLATLILADLLVILSTVDGLFETDAAGRQRVVSVVERISEDIVALDTGEKSARGTGGMGSKLRAAAMTTKAGVPVVVAGGRRANVLTRVAAGDEVGTLFLPASRRMASRKRWIGFTARPDGRLIVDDGARRTSPSPAASPTTRRPSWPSSRATTPATSRPASAARTAARWSTATTWSSFSEPARACLTPQSAGNCGRGRSAPASTPCRSARLRPPSGSGDRGGAGQCRSGRGRVRGPATRRGPGPPRF